ncbi:MAG: DNA repair protein RadC [Erysipelothrix sp.]|nr:DNA repair protein RadC [Erysipelothrix sp.]
MMPREKVKMFGWQSLSDDEVLAIMLRTGVKDFSVQEVAKQLLVTSKGLAGLTSLTMKECMSVKGISNIKAIELGASFELVKRVLRSSLPYMNVIDHPQVLFDWLRLEIGDKQQEHFLVVYLNTQHQIIGVKTLFVGTLDRSIIHPREIFKEAMAVSSSKIMIVHNHPSGTLTPSNADIQVTKNLKEIGELMGIPLLDHLIVSASGYVSLRQMNMFD